MSKVSKVRLKPDPTDSRIASRSAIAGGVSSTSSIRFHDAMPRCSMLVTHPNAIIGQLNIVRYELNATNWPSVMRPRITSRLPSHNTTRAPRPRKNAMLGKKNPCSAMSRRLRARYSSFDRRNRSISAASCRYARTTRTPDSASWATALTSASCAWICSNRL